jgi:hypothetical protein
MFRSLLLTAMLALGASAAQACEPVALCGSGQVAALGVPVVQQNYAVAVQPQFVQVQTVQPVVSYSAVQAFNVCPQNVFVQGVHARNVRGNRVDVQVNRSRSRSRGR